MSATPAMRRVAMVERSDWRQSAESLGFDWSVAKDGTAFWREDAAYAFEPRELERQIERPTVELLHMGLEAVDRVLQSEELMHRMRIPEALWQPIADSWRRGDADIYGRFDFRWDGVSAAKMLEFNAMTAATLFESSVFQWLWYEDMRRLGRLGPDTDQFNTIHDNLLKRFSEIRDERSIHFSCLTEVREDVGTMRYLMDCALQAGFKAHWCPISEVRTDDLGHLHDRAGNKIQRWYPFYYHEWLVNDGVDIAALDGGGAGLLEPCWRAVLGNKGILAVLWAMFPGHPNLLPTYFEDDRVGLSSLVHSWAKKPIFSFEGGNVTLNLGGRGEEASEGPFGEEGFVYQELCPLPSFDGWHAVVGSWAIGGVPSGLAIREHSGLITTPDSHFVPHFLVDS